VAVAESTCVVDGCGRSRSKRGYCDAHYLRVRRTGSPGSAEIKPPGRPQCSVAECGKQMYAKTYCETHYRRHRIYGDYEYVQRQYYVGDNISYNGLHYRLRRWFGSARNQACIFCGMSAFDWAYMGTDPNERYDEATGMPFSPDLIHYQPLCRSCHVRFDRFDLDISKR
jgi:hypothetical protein